MKSGNVARFRTIGGLAVVGLLAGLPLLGPGCNAPGSNGLDPRPEDDPVMPGGGLAEDSADEAAPNGSNEANDPGSPQPEDPASAGGAGGVSEEAFGTPSPDAGAPPADAGGGLVGTVGDAGSSP